MVLTTRPRQTVVHRLRDSDEVSVVRSARLQRLRTICASHDAADRRFILYAFTYGLGVSMAIRVGDAPQSAVWEAEVTAFGRDARVCVACDRYIPVFDCCLDANHVCMECMLAGRGTPINPLPFATPRGLNASPTVVEVFIREHPTEPDVLPAPPEGRRTRRGGRRVNGRRRSDSYAQPRPT